MTVEWQDICERCEAVVAMPADGSGAEHVCKDRESLLALLHQEVRRKKMEEVIIREARRVFERSIAPHVLIHGGITQDEMERFIQEDIAAQQQDFRERMRRRRGGG